MGTSRPESPANGALNTSGNFRSTGKKKALKSEALKQSEKQIREKEQD